MLCKEEVRTVVARHVACVAGLVAALLPLLCLDSSRRTCSEGRTHSFSGSVWLDGDGADFGARSASPGCAPDFVPASACAAVMWIFSAVAV